MFKYLPDPLNTRGVRGFPHGSEGRLLAQPLVALLGRWDGLWWGVDESGTGEKKGYRLCGNPRPHRAPGCLSLPGGAQTALFEVNY